MCTDLASEPSGRLQVIGGNQSEILTKSFSLYMKCKTFLLDMCDLNLTFSTHFFSHLRAGASIPSAHPVADAT